jgi:hypothetical protein
MKFTKPEGSYPRLPFSEKTEESESALLLYNDLKNLTESLEKIYTPGVKNRDILLKRANQTALNIKDDITLWRKELNKK